MGPNLGHIEDIPAVVFSLFGLHDLSIQRPSRVVAPLDSIPHIGRVEIGCFAGSAYAFGLRHALDTLIGFEVEFDINKRAVLKKESMIR